MGACSRTRALKLLLVFVVAVVFEEYVLGLLLEARSSEGLFSSNATARNAQYVQWPKRMQSRQCFDDGVDSPAESPVANATNSTSTEGASFTENTTKKQDFPETAAVNIHNATQRQQTMTGGAVSFTSEKQSSLNTSTTTSDNATYTSSKVNSTGNHLQMPSNSTSGGDSEVTSNLKNASGCFVFCPPIPPGLQGAIKINWTEVPLAVLDNIPLDITQGGRYAPRECKPNYKVAIVVPYRNREAHLSIFLNNIHPFLMKQQIDYQIFVVEQEGKTRFNRASLMNVGFVEAMREREWDCFIFHDVDLIPLDDRNLYTCPSQPRHMSAAIDIFQFKLQYSGIFGGVSALTTEQFRKVNGFSNSFWGWGGEDDDMYNRIQYHKYHIVRYPMSVARYTMLSHEKEKPNPERYSLLMKGKRVFKTDGLNSLHYELKQKLEHRLYTHLLAALRPHS